MGDPTRPLQDSDRAASRDEETEFIQQHLRRIYLLIFRIVGNADDAQDLAQEAFIKALQRRDQLKDLDKAAHWLSRIATNTAIDHLRKQGRVTLMDMNELPEFAVVSRGESPEQFVLRSESRVELDGGLALLSERERMALLLRDVEDLPAEEVAKQMKCSKATVRSHIANARIKFRRYLESRKS